MEAREVGAGRWQVMPGRPCSRPIGQLVNSVGRDKEKTLLEAREASGEQGASLEVVKGPCERLAAVAMTVG